MTEQNGDAVPEGTGPTPEQQPAGAVPPPPGALPPPPGEAPPSAPSYSAPSFQQSGTQVDVGAAFGYGWSKFKENAGTFILGMIVYGVVVGVLASILFAIMSAGASSDAAGALLGVGVFGYAVVAAVASVVFQVGIFRAALDVTQGRPVELKTFFSVPNLGNVLLTAIIVAVLGAIPGVGIILAFFAVYALPYALDKGVGAIDAVKASFNLVAQNIGTTLLLYVGVVIASFVGAILCGIGLLVTIPVAYIAVAWTFRRLNGEQVA